MDTPNKELKQKCEEFLKLYNDGCFLTELQVSVYEINEVSRKAIDFNRKEIDKPVV